MLKILKNEINFFFYNSFILLVPGYLEIVKPYIYARYKNWVLLNDFLVRVSLRRLFLFLLGIIEKNNTILFFFEESNFSVFKPLFKNTKNFATDSVQEGLHFLERLGRTKRVGCLVFIGSFENYSLKSIEKFSMPVIFIAPRLNTKGDFSLFSQLDYLHSNILLKKILETLINIHNNINEKKKTVQKFKNPSRSRNKKIKDIKF